MPYKIFVNSLLSLKATSIFITIGVFVAVVVVFNIFLDTAYKDHSHKAEVEEQIHQHELAENTLYQLVSQKSLNIEHHRSYIDNHFNRPKKKRVRKYKFEYRDDIAIQDLYYSLAQSADSSIADIGHYGGGYIQLQLENYPLAISKFLKVKNKKLPYLNNSLGNAYNQIDSTELAELYFIEEIKNNGNLSGAYSNLTKLLVAHKRIDELQEYLKNPETKNYVPLSVKRTVYFALFQPINYVVVLFKTIFSGANVWGVMAALLILSIWVFYLRRLDIYELEKWQYIIVTVLLGMVFCFLVFPLSDFLNIVVGFDLNGGLLNDFFYCVIGIGAVEEFVKIIPLLLLMRFSKVVNEPYDYILYASLSALGFAFVENILYFNENSLHIIHGRAVTAVVSHMFDSSIIAYGIVLNKYKRHRNPYLNFLFFFVLASFSHGFYDFWLINKTANSFSFLTMMYLLASMFIWNSFKNNALNHSDFYDKDKKIDCKKLEDYLLYTLTGVLLFEYSVITFKSGVAIANNELLSSLQSGTYLIIFLSVSLSKFTINKGQWDTIKFWQGNDDVKYNYDEVLNITLNINAVTKIGYASYYLPNSGQIVKRLVVSKEPDWYMVQLNTPVFHNFAYRTDTVLIRTKNKTVQIKQNVKKHIALYLIPTDANLEKNGLQRTDFKFCGWAITG